MPRPETSFFAVIMMKHTDTRIHLGPWTLNLRRLFPTSGQLAQRAEADPTSTLATDGPAAASKDRGLHSSKGSARPQEPACAEPSSTDPPAGTGFPEAGSPDPSERPPLPEAQHQPGSVVCEASGLALFIASDDSGGSVAKRLPFLSIPELRLRMTAATTHAVAASGPEAASPARAPSPCQHLGI